MPKPIYPEGVSEDQCTRLYLYMCTLQICCIVQQIESVMSAYFACKADNLFEPMLQQHNFVLPAPPSSVFPPRFFHPLAVPMIMDFLEEFPVGPFLPILTNFHHTNPYTITV